MAVDPGEIPDFQTVMRPVLAALADGQEHNITVVRSAIANEFQLTPDQIAEKIPSGRAKTFANRIGWATTYLYRSGLIDRTKRSTYRITDRGLTVLQEHPARVDLKVLSQFQEFLDFRTKQSDSKTADDPAPIAPDALAETPEEQIINASVTLRQALVADLLDRVWEQSWDEFEQLVLDVLHAIGYGGGRPDAGTRLGQSGDEGVDGVIREDELGLDLIYVQAKHWKNPVGRPEIQKFFGALHGKRATKGVFITTSTFTSEAEAYAEGVTPRVILVDGKRLAGLMIDHGVGVAIERVVEIKRVDLDYFAAENLV